MKQNLYCVASPIRERGALASTMASAQEKLRQGDILFTEPKLGKHITFAPPFKATEPEMNWLVAGLEFANAFYCPEGVPKMADGEGLDFFIGEESGEKDALIVRIRVQKNIKDLVERFCAIVPRHTHWKYPPKSYLVNFHATIGKGEGLREAIQAHGGTKKLFKGLNFQPPIQLESPKLFQQEEGLWRPCRM